MFDIKQIIPDGFCLKCSGCCRFASNDSVWFPRLLKEEEVIVSEKRFCPIPNKKEDNFLCPNLDSDNKCKIYKKRPFECTLYPFLINRNDVLRRVFLSIHWDCPYAKKNLKNKNFEEYAEYLAAFLKSEDFLKTLKNNPQIIQSYPGVLNLAELPYEIK